MLPILAIAGYGVVYGASVALGTLGVLAIADKLVNRNNPKTLGEAEALLAGTSAINQLKENEVYAVIHNNSLVGGYTNLDRACDSAPVLKKQREAIRQAMRNNQVFRHTEGDDYYIVTQKRPNRRR